MPLSLFSESPLDIRKKSNQKVFCNPLNQSQPKKTEKNSQHLKLEFEQLNQKKESKSYDGQDSSHHVINFKLPRKERKK